MNTMSALNRRQRGFSLLELMITLSVAAILLVVALPSFRDLMHRSRVSSASNELLASLSYARTEAVSRGQMVSMCASTDGTSCVASKMMEPGWIIYTYPAGAASAGKNYNSSKDLLLRATTARSGVSIRSASTSVITFGQQGQLKPSTPLVFVSCYRVGEGTAAGVSTAQAPGARLDVLGSGSAMSKPVASGGSCSPS